MIFVVALMGTILFPHGSSLSINTKVIMLAHTLFEGFKNQEKVKYYPIALAILSDMYRSKDIIFTFIVDLKSSSKREWD